MQQIRIANNIFNGVIDSNYNFTEDYYTQINAFSANIWYKNMLQTGKPPIITIESALRT